MYMKALENEVEALSAEVTRLRLMTHRISQFMEDERPSNRRYADPMAASLGISEAAPSFTQVNGGRPVQPPQFNNFPESVEDSQLSPQALVDFYQRILPLDIAEVLLKRKSRARKKRDEHHHVRDGAADAKTRKKESRQRAARRERSPKFAFPRASSPDTNDSSTATSSSTSFTSAEDSSSAPHKSSRPYPTSPSQASRASSRRPTNKRNKASSRKPYTSAEAEVRQSSSPQHSDPTESKKKAKRPQNKQLESPPAPIKVSPPEEIHPPSPEASASKLQSSASHHQQQQLATADADSDSYFPSFHGGTAAAPEKQDNTADSSFQVTTTVGKKMNRPLYHLPQFARTNLSQDHGDGAAVAQPVGQAVSSSPKHVIESSTSDDDSQSDSTSSASSSHIKHTTQQPMSEAKPRDQQVLSPSVHFTSTRDGSLNVSQPGMYSISALATPPIEFSKAESTELPRQSAQSDALAMPKTPHALSVAEAHETSKGKVTPAQLSAASLGSNGDPFRTPASGGHGVILGKRQSIQVPEAAHVSSPVRQPFSAASLIGRGGSVGTPGVRTPQSTKGLLNRLRAPGDLSSDLTSDSSERPPKQTRHSTSKSSSISSPGVLRARAATETAHFEPNKLPSRPRSSASYSPQYSQLASPEEHAMLSTRTATGQESRPSASAAGAKKLPESAASPTGNPQEASISYTGEYDLGLMETESRYSGGQEGGSPLPWQSSNGAASKASLSASGGFYAF